ncbi:MAG: UDP-N-acetylmuramoyl-L-alanyl-D-glutamate--2,6-diaminopimelate ligase [Candidatus Zipacnadales bacterium]
MAKRLRDLLAKVDVDPRQVRGGDTKITSVTSDSRTASPGSCFVAVRGFETDGHYYIGAAVQAGATAVVYEDPTYTDSIPKTIACARVANSRQACALLSAAFWDFPDASLTLVGVTGTNGKTTTVHLVETLCREAGYSTGTLGTLGRTVGDNTQTTTHTTLDSVELQAALAQMRDAGVSHVVMEVSSHALSLHRTWGMKFDVAAFTNLSQDHLDFYPTMEDYLNAKALLFTTYTEFARSEKAIKAILNTDDVAGRELLRRAQCPAITYGLQEIDGQTPHVTAREVRFSSSGSRFQLSIGEETATVEFPLLGRFNIMNALCAAGCGLALGLGTQDIARYLSNVRCVPGRFESIDEGQPYRVVVDYAHTPDGLANILTSAREITRHRLICVFGCGGNRDRTKRPQMGRIVEELADVAIMTSDNPRTEEPLAIIDDIRAGLRGCGAEVRVEPDRRKAIELGVGLCEPGDMLVIAGKGHETYQIFADHTIHFDDREEARRVIRARLERERV